MTEKGRYCPQCKRTQWPGDPNQKYCGDGSNKDYEHRWVEVERRTGTASPIPVAPRPSEATPRAIEMTHQFRVAVANARVRSEVRAWMLDHLGCPADDLDLAPLVAILDKHRPDKARSSALRKAGVPPTAHKEEYMKHSKAFVEAYCDGSIGDDEEDREDVECELESMLAKAYADGWDEHALQTGSKE